MTRRGTAAGVRIRAFRADRWDDEVGIVHRLYNECFGDLWGFVPMSESEIAARAAEFRTFYLPQLVLIAEAAGQPVGFGLALPDASQALALARGRLLPLGSLRRPGSTIADHRQSAAPGRRAPVSRPRRRRTARRSGPRGGPSQRDHERRAVADPGEQRPHAAR